MRWKLFLSFLPAVLFMFLLTVLMVNATGGVEMNVVSVIPSTELFGSLGIYIVPLNVSSTNIIQQPTVYVTDQTGVPKYSYLFSSYPPLLYFLEQSVGVSEYSVVYGGTNPYTQFVASPGTPQSIWLVYDDFDYVTGYWNLVNTDIFSGKAIVSKGYISLNTSYGEDIVHSYHITGRRAFLITLNVSSGTVFVSLTSPTFNEWEAIVDGSDIYFITLDNQPLYYKIIYLNKVEGRLDFIVQLRGDKFIMMYGGSNPYTSYRMP